MHGDEFLRAAQVIVLYAYPIFAEAQRASWEGGTLAPIRMRGTGARQARWRHDLRALKMQVSVIAVGLTHVISVAT